MDGAFRDPCVPAAERTAYRGVVRGETLGTGVNTVEPVDGGEYRQTLATRIGEAEYDTEIAFRVTRGELRCTAYRSETRHGATVASREEGYFEDVEVLGWGARVAPYPRDVTPLLGCALALRGLEFRRGTQRTFSLWLANTVYWDVALKVERAEHVDLPLGRRRAWRVRARPDFGQVAGHLDRLINLLLPPFVLHFEEQPPHRLLRFEFPTGPFPWNPRATIEATEVG